MRNKNFYGNIRTINIRMNAAKMLLMTLQYTINFYTGNFPRLQTGRATYMSSVYFELYF